MTDETQDKQKWPLRAVREICTIRRVRGGSAHGAGPHVLTTDPGDILLVQEGNRFNTSVCDGSRIEIKVPFALVRAGEGVLPEFLAMVMGRESFLKNTSAMCDYGSIGSSSGRILLSIRVGEAMGRVNIGLPPVEEQRQIVVNSEKYINHIQQMASNFARLAQTMEKLHLAITGEMLQRKMEKSEIREILQGLSGMLPAGSQQGQAQERPEANRSPGP